MSYAHNRKQVDNKKKKQKETVNRKKIIQELKNEGITFSDLDPETLIKAAKELGQGLKYNDLKNHQLRKLFSAVKGIEYETVRQKTDDRLEKEIVAQLIFLKIHLANAQQKSKNIKGLKDIMDEVLCSKYLRTKKDLDYFVKFFEAILAYHR